MMRLTGPLYEGDSLIRSGPVVRGEPAETGTLAVEPAPADEAVSTLNIAEIETRARAMRAAYIGALLGRLWDRFEAWLEKGRREREEAYLAQSENLADLEARMRRLEREGLVPHL
jgi:hypothetical protein